ncbi:MAG: hypothetical protein JXA77_16395 [Bacteroidales bacterium]|nr:hypothetical protein [Bacteroidales bacterium]MBN2818883.1 hypothetical protein [Bacteroidales bacterium]
MKKLCTILVGILIISFVGAQEQKESEFKAYFNEDNNRLFVNKEQGVYFWISTSPDEDAKKYRLLSDSSKKYTNPMYFDTEGYNTVRSPSAVDTTTKRTIYPLQDIVFKVYADGIPPVSALKIVSPKARYSKGKPYYEGDVTISISVRDAVSGNDKTFISIDDEPFKEYLKEFTLKGSTGELKIKYYSVDKVGNTEEAKTEVITIK